MVTVRDLIQLLADLPQVAQDHPVQLRIMNDSSDLVGDLEVVMLSEAVELRQSYEDAAGED